MSTLGLLLPLLLLLALSPLQTSSLPKPHTLQDKITIANEILSSLDRAMVFLEEKPWYFTTTSMMALRILHVELKGVYYTWVQITQLRPVARRAGYLSKKLVILLQRATDILKVTAPDHLQVFQPAFKMGFWKLIGAWIQTNASLVYNMSQSPIVMENDPTNQCLKELLGTRSNISKPCSYSQFCRNLVTLPVYSGNYMNHQLLYFLISRMIGCTGGLYTQTQHYMNLFCANMMNLNQKAKNSNCKEQALFMGNIMLCGFGGFADFYKHQWLEDILRWQNQEGYFGEQNGYSVHDTAMAMGALGGFLYVLVKFPQAYGRQFQFASASPKPDGY